MKILITGSTGRIGINLIKALKEKNHDIKTLVLPGEKSILKKYDVEIIEGKIEDKSIYSGLLDGIECIYHLAGILPFNVTNDKVFEVNIRGTYNILDAVIEKGIKLKRFIFASSDEVYPSLKPKYLPLNENHPKEPYGLYGLSKLIGEHLSNLYHREFGIPTVCPRFTFTLEAGELLDPGSGAGSMFFLKGKLDRLKSINNPPQGVLDQIKLFEDLYQKYGDSLYSTYDKKSGKPYRMPMCDVRDLVQGLLLILENDNAIGESMGFGPPFAFSFDKAASYLSEKLDMPVIDVELESDLPFNFELDLSKARIMLGYKPEWDIFKMIDDAIDNKAT